MDKIVNILNKVAKFIIDLWEKPIVEFSPIKLLIVVGMFIGVFFFFKYLFKAFIKYSKQGAKLLVHPITILIIKNTARRQNKRLCHTCKNPLHKCTCPDNRNVPYKQRTKKWKAKEKQLRDIRREREAAESQSTVVLKSKHGRKGGR